MELSAESILFLGPETKDQALEFASMISQSVEDGKNDALDIHIRCKAWMLALGEVISKIEEQTLSEAEKYGTKSFDFKGAKIEIREMGSKWNFENTKDPVYSRLQDSIKKFDTDRKDRELFLKSLKSKTTFVDEESGEVFEIFPPYKTSKTGIAISLK